MQHTGPDGSRAFGVHLFGHTAVHTPDRTLRAFLDAYPQASDIEVRGAGLEEAFVRLTADQEVAA